MSPPDLSSVLVAGLGITGQAVVKALKERNSEVHVVDDQPASVESVAAYLSVEVLDSTSKS